MPRIVTWIQKHKTEIILFSAALLIRALLLAVNLRVEQGNLVNTIHGDDGYFEISRNLSQGHGFTGEDHPPYMPNPLRPPVYPLFLAIPLYLTGSYWVVALCQIVAGALIPVLGMALARRIAGSHGVGLAVGYLLALEPYSALLSFVFYTETVFTVLFLSFVLYLLRYFETPSMRLSVLTALFLGLATLVKPTVQYLPILVPLGLAWHWRDRLEKKLALHLGVFLGVFLLLIAPWLMRNKREFGVVGMSAQPSFNLMVYLVPSVRALENGTSFQTEYDRWFEEQDLDWRDITLATSEIYRQRAVEELKKHPVGIAKSVAVTLFTFFTHDGMLVVLQHAGVDIAVAGSRPSLFLLLQNPVRMIRFIADLILSPAIIILIDRVMWMLATVFFFCGVLLFFRKRIFRASALMALCLIAYFALTTTINGLGVNARFRVPVNALILTFAVYAAIQLGNRVSKWKLGF